MKKIKKAACCALIFAALWATAGWAAPFDAIVVFGDSLSDNGNLVFFEGQPEPDPAIYFMGRFSNGPVWVEYLAAPERLNAPLTDRALGGAQTDGLTPPGLIEQVVAHVALANLPLSPDTLFIIWIGGNDFLNGDGDSQGAVNNINDAMQRLAAAGARHLLVLNLPDLGAIPNTLGTPRALLGTAFTLNFNAQLAAMLDQFSVTFPAVALYEFDVFALFNAVRGNPGAFGFINVTTPSPNFVVPDNFDGAGHVFWDERHPTTAMHALLAQRVFEALNQQTVQPGGGVQEESDSGSCFIGTIGGS